ncbi:MAG: hypothetical protein WDA47_07515 [Bacilli bacterium]|jgi:hypothetical protein|nr:hypothetical protein [Defluviitoga tunisiensis]
MFELISINEILSEYFLPAFGVSMVSFTTVILLAWSVVEIISFIKTMIN